MVFFFGNFGSIEILCPDKFHMISNIWLLTSFDYRSPDEMPPYKTQQCQKLLIALSF